MKKETLLEIILGTTGGLIFAIGMCMCLIKEWNLLSVGVVVTIIGSIILLSIIPISRQGKPKTTPKKLDKGLVLTWIIGIIGALILGFGMSEILVEPNETADLVIGLITGVVGLLICILNYPVYSYLKSNRE